MASALSLTMCSTSSTSLLVTDRIASMSLMSSRPMISSLLEWVTVMVSLLVVSADRVGGRFRCGEDGDDGAQERPRRGLVAEIEDAVLGRGEEVGDREPGED